MRYTNNVFEECVYVLFAFLQELNDIYENSNSRICFFNSTKKINKNKFEKVETSIIDISEVRKCFENAFNKLIWRSEDYSLDGVKDFINFLLTAEICFNYDNSDNNNLFSKIEDGNYKLFLNKEKYNIESSVIIEKTKIPNTFSFLNASEKDFNSLFEDDKKVFITTININRTNGTNKISTFKLLSNSYTEFKETTDEILFCQYKNYLREEMKSKFISILNRIIHNNTNFLSFYCYSDFSQHITKIENFNWSWFKDYDIYIWK